MAMDLTLSSSVLSDAPVEPSAVCAASDLYTYKVEMSHISHFHKIKLYIQF